MMIAVNIDQINVDQRRSPADTQVMDDLIDVPAGLNGVAAAETTIGAVHGDEGFYHYREHDAIELARTCSFEAVWHLLERGALPTPGELAAFGFRVENHSSAGRQQL